MVAGQSGVERVYLDWAATAPLCEEAAEAMRPFLEPGRANLAHGMNANSLHTPGRTAFSDLQAARARVARCIGARRPDEVTFTSGATEADNAALFGLVFARVKAERQRGAKGYVPHVVTTAFEHEAVLQAVDVLRSLGCAVTLVAPDAQGFVDPEAVSAACTADTAVVSVMAANNELGTIQPVKELARAAHEAGALFHTDMVQLLGKAPVSMEEIGADAASFSAHMVCVPKGVGALYLRARTPFEPFIVGGGQEDGRRSGTQNVCGAVGFAAACEAACAAVQEEGARQRALRDRLYAELTARPNVRATIDVPAGSERHLPNIASVLVGGFESETLILRLDMLGFCVSGGSACSSTSLEPSHVLRAIGVSADDALGSLRVSIGRYTTEADVDAFVKAFDQALDWENR